MAAGTPLRTGESALQLGFNLEWKTFQSEFWVPASGRVSPDLVQSMSKFPTAVYRFPGGTVSNYLDMAGSLGAAEERPKQRAVAWAAPEPMSFGLGEYYDFVTAVGGRPWLVLNVFGRFEGAQPGAALSASWTAVSDYAKKRGAPLRWELGNELYLDHYSMSAAEYAQRALQATEVVGSRGSGAAFVATLADIDTAAHRKVDFNRRVAMEARSRVSEFAQHSYYDGPPGGPPVPNRLREICRTIEQLSADGVSKPGIWVTEHARWPGGRTSDRDWGSLWWRTNNLEAGLGVADYLLGLTQIPQVRGAFLHALSGTQGPWALFLKGKDGTLVPSAVYRTLQVLWPLVVSADTFTTVVRSPHLSGYAGGYDLRAVVLRGRQTGVWSVLAINRSGRTLATSITVPSLAGVTGSAEHRFISGDTKAINNSAERPRDVDVQTARSTLAFDREGQARMNVPPYSVNAIQLPTASNSRNANP